MLSVGPSVNEPTGRRSFSLTLTNTTASACELFGYPTVRLLTPGGEPLAFEYRDEGDQVVTARAPAPVELAPGRVAYLTIDKSRCDRGALDSATVVEVTPPGANEPLSLPIGDGHRLNYCGAGDPGSLVEVSPVEPTERATLAH